METSHVLKTGCHSPQFGCIDFFFFVCKVKEQFVNWSQFACMGFFLFIHLLRCRNWPISNLIKWIRLNWYGTVRTIWRQMSLKSFMISRRVTLFRRNQMQIFCSEKFIIILLQLNRLRTISAHYRSLSVIGIYSIAVAAAPVAAADTVAVPFVLDTYKTDRTRSWRPLNIAWQLQIFYFSSWLSLKSVYLLDKKKKREWIRRRWTNVIKVTEFNLRKPTESEILLKKWNDERKKCILHGSNCLYAWSSETSCVCALFCSSRSFFDWAILSLNFQRVCRNVIFEKE